MNTQARQIDTLNVESEKKIFPSESSDRFIGTNVNAENLHIHTTTTEYRNAKRIFIFTLDKAKIATLAPGL